MKLVLTLSRIAVLSLAAAAFVGLTAIYGDAASLPLPNAHWQAEHQHRAPAPQLNKFGEVVAEGIVVAIYAIAGRLLLRLRLSRVPTSKAPVGLSLDRQQARAQRSERVPR